MHRRSAYLAAKEYMPDQKTFSRPTREGRRQAGARRLLNQRNGIIGFAILCVLALIVVVVRASSRPVSLVADRADVTNTQLVAQGKQIYITRCATCHGSDLQGEPGWPERRPNGVMPAAPLDARGTAWQRPDQWLFTTIKQGGQATAAAGSSSFMPAFGGGLTDAEIWALISFIKSTWPKNLQDAQSQRK